MKTREALAGFQGAPSLLLQVLDRLAAELFERELRRRGGRPANGSRWSAQTVELRARWHRRAALEAGVAWGDVEAALRPFLAGEDPSPPSTLDPVVLLAGRIT